MPGPLLIPLVSLGVSAASSIYGAAKKAKASKELKAKQEGVNQKMGALSAWYEGEAERDYMDTGAAKSTIARLKEQHLEANKAADNENVRGGGTQESVIATKSKTNKSFNNALSNMVGYGTQYKDNMRSRYGQSLQGMYNNNEHLYGKEVDSWGNLVTGGTNAVGQIAGSTDWSSLGKKSLIPETP